MDNNSRFWISSIVSQRREAMDTRRIYQDAITYYDKAPEMDPNDVNSSINKGIALSYLGQRL